MVASKAVLALDVGEKRIGVAVAALSVGLPRPLPTLPRAEESVLLPKLAAIIEEEGVSHLVVGWPRGLSGQSTQQTKSVEQFAEMIKAHFRLPLYLQDEALSSQRAEQELNRRSRPYKRQDIDALAAGYILDDWLMEHTELMHP